MPSTSAFVYVGALHASCFMTMEADFMKMPFSDNTFDAIFAIEATCHAPDVVCHTPNLNELSM
jgi:hypothetical protein